MPLRAISDGKDFIAPLLNDEEWALLRSQVQDRTIKLTMPCCGAKCFLRENQLGTRHFVHTTAGNCDWKPETIDHIEIKSHIAIACAKAGWRVKTEARRAELLELMGGKSLSSAIPELTVSDWRADALAWMPDKALPIQKLAFEIQWSKQNLAVTRERQAKYSADGIQCFWLFRTLPDKLDSSRPRWIEESHSRWNEDASRDLSHLFTEALPMFQIIGDRTSGYRVKLGACLAEMPLADFVLHLLNGDIVFRRYIRVEYEYYESDSRSTYYKSICGKSMGRSKLIRPHNHWCFSEARQFCPNEKDGFDSDDPYWNFGMHTAGAEYTEFPEE